LPMLSNLSPKGQFLFQNVYFFCKNTTMKVCFMTHFQDKIMNSKIKFLGLLFVAVFLTFSCYAATIYVSPEGDDTTAIIDDPWHPFQTIQAALNASNSKDQIILQKGTFSITPKVVPYYDPVPTVMAPIQMVKKSDIFIIGQGDETIVEGKGAGDFWVLQNCTNITLSGIKFVGNHPSVPDGELNGNKVPLLFSMVLMREYNNGITITNCSFHEFGNHAVSHLWSPKTSQNVTIINNSFYSGGATNVTNLNIDGSAVSGIGSYWNVNSNYIANCQRGLEIECFSPLVKHDILLQNNYFTNMLDYGIMLFASCQQPTSPINFTNIAINNNKLRKVNYGILVTGGKDIEICGNTVSGSSQVGISAMSSFNTLDEVVIKNNMVDNCIERGIQFVKGIYRLGGATISDNTVYVTGNSAILAGGTNTVLESNLCYDCGWMGNFGGIEIFAGAQNVQVLNNKLFNTRESVQYLKYGIIIQANASDTYLSKNYINLPAYSAIKDSGLNTNPLHLQYREYDGKLYLETDGISSSMQTIYSSNNGKDWYELTTQKADSYGKISLNYYPTESEQVFFKAVTNN